MPACDLNLEKIDVSECLAESLPKLNNNFNSLEQVVCDLKQRVDKLVNVRTFFYYGPNGQNNPTSGMDNNNTTRPSNQTIEAFVNSPTQLALPSISFPDDIAYVVYQKTGYFTTDTTKSAPEALEITNLLPASIINRSVVNTFAPIFVIWKLTYNGAVYTIDLGFPKFAQASTSTTGAYNANWNQPQNWTTF